MFEYLSVADCIQKKMDLQFYRLSEMNQPE